MESLSLVVGKYHHAPLKDPRRQVRLLSLHPGEWNDEVSCDLQVLDLSTAPKYQAISYTWGPGIPLSRISINGAAFKVRENCLYALKQARLHKDPDCLLWIDSICIDQTNLSEKGSQVSIMGDIFERAHSVLACVGAATEESVFLFDHMDKIADIRKRQQRCGGCSLCIVPVPLVTKQYTRDYRHAGLEWLSAFEGAEIEQFEEAIYKFAKREYWSRAWIVQEILLAQESYLLCGDRLLQTSNFLFALEIIDKIGGVSLESGSSMNPLEELAPRKGVNLKHGVVPTFQSTQMALSYKEEQHAFVFTSQNEAYRVSNFGCTDFRDRIYGLLKVIPWPGFCGPPEPDYRISRCNLLLDVGSRLGRRWFYFVEDVYWMSRALGLLIGEESLDNGDYSIVGNFVQDHSGKSFGGDNSKPCQEQCHCDFPAVPRIAFVHNVRKYGVVDNDRGRGKGIISVSLYTQNTPDAHARLEFHRDEGSDHFIAATLEPDCPTVSGDPNDSDDSYDYHNLIFWSSVQLREGDIVAEIEKYPEPMDSNESLRQWSRLCLILRDAGEDYYSICGHAEIYGNTRWCPGGVHCSEPPFQNPCSSEERDSTRFLVCLDASDAVLYILCGRPDDQRGRDDVPGILEFAGYQSECGNLSFTHNRFSSYAIKFEKPWPVADPDTENNP